MKLIVEYFNTDKYIKDWGDYNEASKRIHSNRLTSPQERGFFHYLYPVEINTETYREFNDNDEGIKYKCIIEIDNDFLYKTDTNVLLSHLHTIKIANEMFFKYDKPSHKNPRLYQQIERDLKLKEIGI